MQLLMTVENALILHSHRIAQCTKVPLTKQRNQAIFEILLFIVGISYEVKNFKRSQVPIFKYFARWNMFSVNMPLILKDLKLPPVNEFKSAVLDILHETNCRAACLFSDLNVHLSCKLLFSFSRYVVHAEVEEVWIVATAVVKGSR